MYNPEDVLEAARVIRLNRLPQPHIIRQQQRNPWHLQRLQQRHQLKILYLHRPKKRLSNRRLSLHLLPVKTQIRR